MARCLVLGANGFIGSHLVDDLIAAGHHVRAFDRFHGTNASVNFKPHPNIEKYKGDFLSRASLSGALEEVDYVFHFISTTTPASADNDPLIDIETNIKMSVELFQECVTHKVKKVIFASTGGAIYGNNEHGPFSETTLAEPTSPYAIGKLTIEHYLRYFRVKHGLDSVVYRLSNPYGDRQPLMARQGVIPIFLQHIQAGEAITVLGDGSMVRDYLYINDATRMIAKSFEHAKESLYNLGSGQGVSVNELIALIEEVTGMQVVQEHAEVPKTFVHQVVLDTQRFQKEFGIKPAIELREGIEKTWQYVKEKA